MEGRKESRESPYCKGRDRKGRETGREMKGGEREEREGSSLPSNKKSFPRPWPVSINLAARLKCYRRHGP